jgi:phosphatidylglycerophosphate synthase
MSERATTRRAVAVRGLAWVRGCAAWLSRRSVSPNQISWLSVLFAALAAWLLAQAGRGAGRWSWLLAALAIQLRLLCNLFDGMVAVEGGKRTPSGEIFNDLPDRLSDPLILVAAGYAIPMLPLARELGWLAGLSAVLTAYSRVLGVACGARACYCGPMAKQHRMAVMTMALLTPAVVPGWRGAPWVVYGTLGAVVAGCGVTVLRRVRAAVHELEAGHGRG